MADETKTNATPEAPGGPPAPEQTEQAVIPGMDGGPAPSGKVIDLSDVRAEAGKTGPESPAPGEAHLLSGMDSDALAKLEAVMDSGEYTGSVKDLINLTQNLDNYDFYPDVDSEEAMGRLYIQEFEAVPVPEHLIDYIDYEAYGRDVRINEGGHFAPGGYVMCNHGSFVEHYHGIEDIPPEHRVFAYPQLNIREQMAAYQEVIDRSALNEGKQRLSVSREDR